MSDPITHLEELSLNAWPARQTVYYDGWVLRFADGYTRRANSVNPLYPSSLPLPEKIAHCERVYASQGLRTVFKLTPAVHLVELDHALAERGYREEAPTSVQTLDLDGDAPLAPAGTSAAGAVPCERDEWLRIFARLSNAEDRNMAIMADLLAAVVPPVCYLTLACDGAVIAAGLAVAERGHIGLFDVVTATHARNRGFGRLLVAGLLRWGREQGASRAYLQVVCDNAPALRLYAALGFREAYRYWYRVR